MPRSPSADLWTLALDRAEIEPEALTRAMEQQIARKDLDFRTRLLIRDSLNALAKSHGSDFVVGWLAASPAGVKLREIWDSDLGPEGFPSLGRRIMDVVRPERVRQFLRDLGTQIPRSAQIVVGGSIALILEEMLARYTEDLDVVDEVPAEIRSQYALLERLAQRYNLRVTHFQSHYLPTGWRDRVRSLGEFGRLFVFLVDPYDIFVGKLFSARDKDLDDLRTLAPSLDRAKVEDRVRRTTSALMSNPKFAQDAERNWYVVFGEALPS